MSSGCAQLDGDTDLLVTELVWRTSFDLFGHGGGGGRHCCYYMEDVGDS